MVYRNKPVCSFSVQQPNDFSIVSESRKYIFLANVAFVLRGVSYCLKTMGICKVLFRERKGMCNLMVILLWYVILFYFSELKNMLLSFFKIAKVVLAY